MAKLKFWLYASLAVNIVLVSVFAFKLYHNWFEPGVLQDSFRESIFNAAPREEGKIYFVGDSHTEAFELVEFLQNADVRNRGIWGDISENVLRRMDNILQQKPRKLFIMIGLNDICLGIPVNKIADNVENIIKKIQDSVPAARIYLESVLPDDELIYHSRVNTMVRIKELNNLYARLGKKYGITFINLYPFFLENKGLKKSYSFDGAHLNGTGYALLARLLKPYVEQ